MKTTNLVIATVLVTTFLFTAALYSSCKKTTNQTADQCRGITCMNNGTCSNGTCVCPTGYSGSNCEMSTIVLRNNAPSTVLFTLNGAKYALLTNTTMPVTGPSGTPAVLNDTAQNIEGLPVITSHDSVYFPVGGAGSSLPTTYFNVPSGYVYLYAINNYPSPMIKAIVDFGGADEVFANLIDHDGLPHSLGGYFKASLGMKIGFAFSDGAFKEVTPSLPDTLNQICTVTIP